MSDTQYELIAALETLQARVDDLDVIQLLKKHTPPERLYLVDRLTRALRQVEGLVEDLEFEDRCAGYDDEQEEAETATAAA